MCCLTTNTLTASYQEYLDQLTAAGLLIPSGVRGLYGHSGVFEDVIERFEQAVTRRAVGYKAEVMRFPAIMSRQTYLKTTHMDNFPDLMGSVQTFLGNERDHVQLRQKRDAGEDWTRDLEPTEVMMTPAACYPLYPTATGTMSEGGRIVDLRSFVFRHEPSNDPCRMQIFRQREFVRLGSAEEAVAHRDEWLDNGEEVLNSVGLKVERVVANDPFFGRAGRMMAATQKEQVLKYELVIAVASTEKPTAITSCNCHLDHFGHTFDIKTADGKYAHSACIGFGLERIALALFKTHGFDPDQWPSSVKNVLGL